MLPFGMKSAPQPSLPLNSCLPGASYLPQPSFRRRPPAPTQFCRFTRRGGPFVFILLRIPFPATLLFSHPYETPGCPPPDISVRDFGPLCPPCLCGKSYIISSLPPLLSLFALFKKVNSFAIKQIQPLFAKHR